MTVLAVLNYAHMLDGLRDLGLVVTVRNDPARKRHIDAGFAAFVPEHGSINVDSRYREIEWTMLHVDRATE